MLVSLLGALVLGIIGLVLDKPKTLASVSAGGSVLALVFFASAC